MSYHPDALRRIHRIALQPITEKPFYSEIADEMLLMAAAHESHMGRSLQQIGGPALGLYGIEPDTLHDNYDNYLNFPGRTTLRNQIAEVSGIDGPDLEALKHNPLYGAIHARLKLWRSGPALPDYPDLERMASYLKTYYNSNKGKATMYKYLSDYDRYVMWGA